jgi:8-oxo-dGTP diphosphatase
MENSLLNSTIQKSIYNQPRHYVAVDCAIFGYEAGELKLLLCSRDFEPAKGKWSLMGGFVQEDESMDDAARRVLLKTTGLKDIFMEQVAAFSSVDRDPGDRVISMTFVALIRIDQHDSNSVRENGAHWWPVHKIPGLVFDHSRMVVKALEALQKKAANQLIGMELLPEMFTLIQLRHLYEVIFQRRFDPGNFRKKVLSLGVLEKLNIKNTTESRKGAFYYRFKQDVDSTKGDRLFKIY